MIAAGLLTLGLVAVLLAVPFVTRERDVVEVAPQPDPLFNVPLVEVPPRASACMDRVTFTDAGERATIRVGTFGGPAQPLDAVVEAGGRTQRVPIPSSAYTDSAPLTFAIDPPPADALGRFCIRNRGRGKVALYASADTKTRSDTFVDGKLQGANFQLVVRPAETRTLVERLPEAARRTGVFRPGGPWLVWPLAGLVVLGFPLVLLWALVRSLRAPDGAPRSPRP